MSYHSFHRSSCRSSLARYVVLCTAAFVVPALAIAQSTGKITGIVEDGETHTPLKSATVMLRDPADSTAKPLGDLTDEKGTFSIERVVIGKTYTLEVRYAGYEKYVAENTVVTAGKPTVSLGTIALQTQPVEADALQVTAPREQVRILADKTVYGVEGNPAYTATNVSELLAEIPSVDVDQDGKVSLRGNDNVTIMMNDRPLTMPAEQRNKFLQSLPAEMVKDIEVRTNPGAQFEAKNQGGIINIVTRRTMSDLIGGNVNGGVDTRGGVNGGSGLYFNGNQLNASLGGGVHYGPNQGSSSSLRLNYLDTNERRDVGSGTSESSSGSWYGYGQIDYRFTENDLASLSFNLNNWSSDHSSYGIHTFYNINDAIVSQSADTSAPNPNTPNSGAYNSASLLLKHTFAEEHKISLDISYNSNSYDYGNSYRSIYYQADGTLDSLRSTGRTSYSQQSNATIITSLNYENPLSDQLKLSFGGRNEINDLDNNTSVSNRDRSTGEFVPDTLQTNHYLPRNTVYALYGNAAYRPFKGLSLQAGVRLEQANVSAKYASGEEIISRDYTNIFPSGSIAFDIADQHTLTFSYRRSVALPDVDALNPVKIKWSDFYEYSGNPDLEPEFTQSFELSYNTYWGMGNMISVSPYYSTSNGDIENSQQLVNNATYSRSENFNGTYSLGSEASLSLRPFDWLNFRASGSIYQKVNRGSAIPGDIHSSATGYSGSIFFNADLMKGLTFSANTFFNTPPLVGGNQRGGYVFANVSLRQKLLDDKLSLTLQVRDPFNLQEWHSTYDSPEFYTESTSRWSSRSVGLNISYTFGTTPRMERHQQEKTETKGGGGAGGGGGSQGGGQ